MERSYTSEEIRTMYYSIESDLRGTNEFEMPLTNDEVTLEVVKNVCRDLNLSLSHCVGKFNNEEVLWVKTKSMT